MELIGHNGGPSLNGGKGWRIHCWRKARADLLPHLPIEVVRTRVKRAAELGLDYKTYAGVRATTGRDLLAFLFSSNALHLVGPNPVLADDRAGKLAALKACNRLALAQAPLTPASLKEIAPALDAAYPAPSAFACDRVVRQSLISALQGIPADAVLLVADAPWESRWCTTARLAACLPADRFFKAAGQETQKFA